MVCNFVFATLEERKKLSSCKVCFGIKVEWIKYLFTLLTLACFLSFKKNLIPKIQNKSSLSCYAKSSKLCNKTAS